MLLPLAKEEHITKLEGPQLERVVANLITSAAESHTVQRFIRYQNGANAPGADGGLDATLDSLNHPFLPNGSLGIQCKAVNNFSPSDCGKEIIGADGKLKPFVASLINQNGIYVLIDSRQALNAKMMKDRLSAILKTLIDSKEIVNTVVLAQLKKDYSDLGSKNTLRNIMIVDVNKLTEWINQDIAGLATAYEQLQIPTLGALRRWGKVSDERKYNTLFEFVESRERELKKTLSFLDETSSARIIGAPGVGCTRFAFHVAAKYAEIQLKKYEEKTKKSDKEKRSIDFFLSRIVYVLHDESLYHPAGTWAERKIEGTLIVDGCNSEQHKKLQDILRASSITLLTINHEPLFNWSDNTVILAPFKKDEYSIILKMLKQAFNDLTDEECLHITLLSEGNAGMAVLIAQSLANNSDKNILDLGRQDIFKRIHSGRVSEYPVEANTYNAYLAIKLLPILALFTDFSKKNDNTINFIHQLLANPSQVSNMEIISALSVLEKRFTLGNAGEGKLYVTPKPFVFYLLTQFWEENYSREQDRIRVVHLIMQKAPEELAMAFSQQFRYLQGESYAMDISNAVCGNLDTLLSLNIFENPAAMRFLISITEIYPPAGKQALALLYAYLKANPAELNADMIKLLFEVMKKLCFISANFNEGVKFYSQYFLLLKDQRSLQEDFNGKMTFFQKVEHDFLRLFQTEESATEMPPKERLEVVRELLSQHDDQAILMLQAMCRAFYSHGENETASQTAGLHGSRSPQKSWPSRETSQNDIDDNVHAYQEEVATLLIEQLVQHEHANLATEAARLVVQNKQRLVADHLIGVIGRSLLDKTLPPSTHKILFQLRQESDSSLWRVFEKHFSSEDQGDILARSPSPLFGAAAIKRSHAASDEESEAKRGAPEPTDSPH